MTPRSWLSVRPSIRKGAIAAWAFAWVLGSLGDTASAQQTRARGKSGQARLITRNEIPLGDMTTGRLESLFRVLRSDAPEWDNAQVFSVRFSDPIDASQSGHARPHDRDPSGWRTNVPRVRIQVEARWGHNGI
jgi:hypothetical protein